jgi:hypothetical protein
MLAPDSPAVSRQRDNFRRLLDRMSSDEKVDLVAEEWGCESESFAKALADERLTRYVNINTESGDLDVLQIPRDYMGSLNYTADQKRGWLQKRETFMLEKIHNARGAARTLLVICGFIHLKPLAERLGDGEQVIAVDYRKEAWYRGDVFFPDSF